MDTFDHAAFARMIVMIAPQAVFLRAWKLQGGISAQTHALEYELDGRREKVVVREYGEANLRGNPAVASDECKLLQLLQVSGIPVPKALLCDEFCRILSNPYLVIDFIEGQTIDTLENPLAYVGQMGEALAGIHGVIRSEEELSFLPRQESVAGERIRQWPDKLDEPLSEGLIRKVLQSNWPPRQRNASSLLHGDFWPGNIMARNNQIVAVIDWEDAAYGDPLSDLANARLEVLLFFGIEAMDELTRSYRSAMTPLDYSNLPLWELYAALRPAGRMSDFGLDADTLEQFRERHRYFVNRALEQLK